MIGKVALVLFAGLLQPAVAYFMNHHLQSFDAVIAQEQSAVLSVSNLPEEGQNVTCQADGIAHASIEILLDTRNCSRIMATCL